MNEMSQVMRHIRRYIITQIEREIGSRRVVGRITSCPGIILEPRVPPNEGQGKEKAREEPRGPKGDVN